ncbi:MAG: relaxase/mobilization nuclease domain-containing protein [Prevotella sp.]|nr:relaxase/mobilization nuclease domain-containing protein [Prevotella sp.]
MINFGYIANLGTYTWEDLTNYLKDYTSKNSHIKYPQFHLAISCRGDEYTQEELVAIAHRYLDEMGYGQPGQPLLIYGHHDTDNNHIHIITSRIDPHGKKIDHNFEKRRSQDVINRIMGIDESQQVGETVSKACQYHFSTVPQFTAILETMGYECYTEDNEIVLKRNGEVQEKVKMQLVESKISQERQDKKRMAQLKAILKKYRDMSANRQELQDVMKDKFGVSLVFLGSKDSPYGYLIVDHHTKAVFKGSDVVKVKELLQFQSTEERFKQMDAFIDQMLYDNINLTTKELNRLLHRQFGTKLLNGSIQYGDSAYRLPEHILTTLRSNDRRAWLQSFNPTNEQELHILCQIGKYHHPKRITIQSTPESNVSKTVSQLRHIFDTTSDNALLDKLHEDGYYLTRVDDQYYCIDFANRTIINMNDYGLDVKRLQPRQVQKQQDKRQHISGPGIGRAIDMVAKQRGGSNDSNREWEVGRGGNEDDDRSMKR